MADLSELEHVVLGIIWKKGPCTPYLVRKEFLTSPSPHFSGSEGAIYPLVRRLEKRALLKSKADRTGKRPRRLFQITSDGLAMLRDWLKPPFCDDAAAPGNDLLRTRLYFLAALPPAKQEDFLRDAQQQLKVKVPELKKYIQQYEQSGDIYSELASRGMLHATRARITWIKEVKSRLSKTSVVSA